MYSCFIRFFNRLWRFRGVRCHAACSLVSLAALSCASVAPADADITVEREKNSPYPKPLWAGARHPSSPLSRPGGVFARRTGRRSGVRCADCRPRNARRRATRDSACRSRYALPTVAADDMHTSRLTRLIRRSLSPPSLPPRCARRSRRRRSLALRRLRALRALRRHPFFRFWFLRDVRVIF